VDEPYRQWIYGQFQVNDRVGSNFEPTIPLTIGITLPILPHKPGISYKVDGHSHDCGHNSELQDAVVPRAAASGEGHR
jgi:hypothetical protein